MMVAICGVIRQLGSSRIEALLESAAPNVGQFVITADHEARRATAARRNSYPLLSVPCRKVKTSRVRI
jgi:hypothetical protein